MMEEIKDVMVVARTAQKKLASIQKNKVSKKIIVWAGHI
jgi:hypothetical protein